MANNDPITLKQAASRLKAGQIGVIPTDTLYGVVVSANNQETTKRLFDDVKKRENKTGTIIAASIDQLVELGMKRRYLTAVEQFWPGPISIVIPTGMDLEYLHHGKQSLAVRIPAEKELLELLKETGPLLTSSANLAGKPEANSVDEARSYFGDKLDFYVDGGNISGRLPSTIIQINDDAVEVLRTGAVKIDEATGKIIQ